MQNIGVRAASVGLLGAHAPGASAYDGCAVFTGDTRQKQPRPHDRPTCEYWRERCYLPERFDSIALRSARSADSELRSEAIASISSRDRGKSLSCPLVATNSRRRVMVSLSSRPSVAAILSIISACADIWFRIQRITSMFVRSVSWRLSMRLRADCRSLRSSPAFCSRDTISALIDRLLATAAASTSTFRSAGIRNLKCGSSLDMTHYASFLP